MKTRTWIRPLVVAGLLLASIGFSSGSVAHAEDWKGTPEDSEFSVGALMGLGIFNGSVGAPLLGTISKKIVHQGFVTDINNSVSLEAELGPQFLSAGTIFSYSVHLRWDFNKDKDWTLYALGGLGGAITGGGFNNQFQLYPRFGIGALWNFTEVVALRGEVSHEWIAVGANVPLWR